MGALLRGRTRRRPSTTASPTSAGHERRRNKGALREPRVRSFSTPSTSTTCSSPTSWVLKSGSGGQHPDGVDRRHKRPFLPTPGRVRRTSFAITVSKDRDQVARHRAGQLSPRPRHQAAQLCAQLLTLAGGDPDGAGGDPAVVRAHRPGLRRILRCRPWHRCGDRRHRAIARREY